MLDGVFSNGDWRTQDLVKYVFRSASTETRDNYYQPTNTSLPSYSIAWSLYNRNPTYIVEFEPDIINKINSIGVKGKHINSRSLLLVYLLWSNLRLSIALQSIWVCTGFGPLPSNICRWCSILLLTLASVSGQTSRPVSSSCSLQKWPQVRC